MLFQILMVFTTHVALPLFFIMWVGIGKAESKLAWALSFLLAVVYLALIHMTGGWFWVGIFWPWLFWLALAGCTDWFLRHRWSALRRKPATRQQWIEPGITFLVVLFVGAGLPSALTTRSFTGEPVVLQFPLVSGIHHVIQGGSSAVTNHHTVSDAQSYALDIVTTNAAGLRARGIRPTRQNAYFIWGESVVAPCSGEVVAVENALPDLPLPQADEINVAGNYIAIACSSATVVMGHLQEGSIPFRLGESVALGAPVGQVGNSGNTSEPHLHIHAVRGRVSDYDELVRYGEGVPMVFDGRFLIRNDRMRGD